MSLAMGLSVHTGWAACVVAAGSLRAPRLESREHMELLGDSERFVFHRAADMKGNEAARAVAQAKTAVVGRAVGVMKRLVAGSDVVSCAIVAKPGTMPALQHVLASHPRIHTAEGLFYRDALVEAAQVCGLRVRIVAPDSLDPNDPRLVAVGRTVGKPWSRDWKLASLAAWASLAP